MAKNGQTISNALSKALIDTHHKHGYDATAYFRWMVDDVLAGFGVPMVEQPPKEVNPVLFDLSRLYANVVNQSTPFYDVLGETYMDMVSRWGQKALGQYFTPWPVAMMMARMMGGKPSRKGLIRVCDPACGSGVMALAMANNVYSSDGPEALRQYSFTGIDLDHFCARIFACQMLANTLVHQVEVGEILVYHGNTLGDLAALRVVLHATAPSLSPEEFLPAKAPARESMIKQAARAAGEQLALFDEVREVAGGY